MEQKHVLVHVSRFEFLYGDWNISSLYIGPKSKPATMNK